MEQYKENPYLLFTHPTEPAAVTVLSHNVDKRNSNQTSDATGFTPANYPNGNFLQMLYSPAADLVDTLQRQSIVSSLVEDSESCKTLVDASGAPLRLQSLFASLSKIPKSESDKAHALNSRSFYLKDEDRAYIPKNNLELLIEATAGLEFDAISLESLDSSVSQTYHDLQSIETQYKKTGLWATEVLQAMPHNFFKLASSRARKLFEAIPTTCTAQTIYDIYRSGDRQHLATLSDTTNTICKEAVNSIAIAGFATLAREGNYTKVHFEADGPIEFTAGTNFTKSESRRTDPRDYTKRVTQVPNDSLPDKPIRVLAGANMTGKSFALETHLYQQQVAQTFGYVPAESARTRPVGSLAFVDRSSTNASHDLSAFGAEIVN